MSTVWYVVKVLPGKERILKDNLNTQISLGKIKNILRFVCPTEKSVVMVRKKRTIREKVLYSGYLYFESETDLSEDQLKSISSLKEIMDLNGQKTPVKLKEYDVKRIIVDEKLESHLKNNDINFNIGDYVLITEGAFKNFQGKIIKIDEENVDLEVTIFGRLTNISILKTQIIKK